MVKKYPNYTNKIFLVLAGLLALLVFFAGAKQYYTNRMLDEFLLNTTEIQHVGVELTPPHIYYYLNECFVLDTEITADQAMSIEQAEQGTIFVRPLTHDISSEIFKFYNIRILAAKISSFDTAGVYYANILLTDGDKIYNIDARPSDMTAYSLRFETKMYINNILLSNFTNLCQKES